MPAKCLSLVRGRVLRVVRLDGCGRPVYGPDSVGTSKGFVSAAFTANTIETDEINVTNANGERCVYEPAEQSLASYSAVITFCEVDPEFFSIVTGYAVVTDFLGNAIGFAVDTNVSLTAQGFSLEIWTGAGAGDACSDPNAQGNFGYVLSPFLKGGIVGDFTIENNAVTFTLTGATTRDGNQWGVGPFDVVLGAGGVAGPLLSPLTPTTPLQVITTQVAPPAPVCGSRPLLDPDAEAITAITGTTTVGSLVVAFEPTPDDVSEPTWYDFGDGTWVYLPSTALGATNHTYATAGTYTVKASTNGTWVTTTVTVPGE